MRFCKTQSVFIALLFPFVSVVAQVPLCTWATSAVTPGGMTNAYANDHDPQGNSLVLGAYNTINGAVDLDPSANSVNVSGLGIFAAKYDPSGNLLWAAPVSALPNSQYGSVTPRAIASDTAGNVYISGSVYDCTVDFDLQSSANPVYTTAGNSDMFLAKYNSNGVHQWSYLLGSVAWEDGKSIVCLGQSVYLCGNYGCYTDFDPSAASYVPVIAANCTAGFIAKYTSDGNFVWHLGLQSLTFGDPGYATPATIRADKNQQLICAGIFGGTPDFNPGPAADTVSAIPANSSDAFIAKYDTSGNYIYMRQIVSLDLIVGAFMDLDRNGNDIILSGYLNGPTDFDPGAGTFVITPNEYGMGTGSDAFLAKYDNAGNFIWAGLIGANGYEAANDVSVDASNSILVCGTYNQTIDLDPSAGVSLISGANNCNGCSDGFIAKYDANGNLIYGFNVSAFGNDYATAIDYDQNHFTVTGAFAGAFDFHPGSGTVMLSDDGFYHAQYFDTLTVSGINDLQPAGATGLFPNPANGIVCIIGGSDYETYSVFAATGQLIASGTETRFLDLSSFASGYYLLVLTDAKGNIRHERLIRE